MKIPINAALSAVAFVAAPAAVFLLYGGPSREDEDQLNQRIRVKQRHQSKYEERRFVDVWNGSAMNREEIFDSLLKAGRNSSQRFEVQLPQYEKEKMPDAERKLVLQKRIDEIKQIPDYDQRSRLMGELQACRLNLKNIKNRELIAANAAKRAKKIADQAAARKARRIRKQKKQRLRKKHLLQQQKEQQISDATTTPSNPQAEV